MGERRPLKVCECHTLVCFTAWSGLNHRLVLKARRMGDGIRTEEWGGDGPAFGVTGNQGGQRQKHHLRGPRGFQKGSRDRWCGGRRIRKVGGSTKIRAAGKIQGMG